MKYTAHFIVVAIMLIMIGCTDSSPPALSLHIDTAPTNLEVFAPNIISTSLTERDIAITNEGDAIFFSVSTPDQSIRAIAFVEKIEDTWSTPKVVSFSGIHDDIEPALSPDGTTLFFASTRPLKERDDIPDYNIWTVPRNGDGWGQPQALDTLINSDGNEYFPSVSANGNLYFTASRSDAKGLEDIYMSAFINGEYVTPVSLDTMINSALYEYNAYISPDESFLVFGSFGRTDGQGGGDLYISKRNANGDWMPARNLGSDINSPKLDYCPFVDIKNNVFYFTSDRGSAVASDSTFTYDDIVNISGSIINGTSNIYHITADVLHLE